MKRSFPSVWCSSSLSRYHWFKVLWENAGYLSMFLMSGQQWNISTAQRRRSDPSHLQLWHNPTSSKCSYVFLLSTGSMFVSKQKKHNAALLFRYSRTQFHCGVVDKQDTEETNFSDWSFTNGDSPRIHSSHFGSKDKHPKCSFGDLTQQQRQTTWLLCTDSETVTRQEQQQKNNTLKQWHSM